MQTFELPPYETFVHLVLFCDISNASDLRKRLITASTLPDDSFGNQERKSLDFAFIDASSVVSVQHVMTAVHQALISSANDSLRTKTVHSEIIWNLDPGSNISDSLRHFGLSDKTKHLLLVKISSEPEDTVSASMRSLVQGQIVPLSQLGSDAVNFSAKALRKLYKLNTDLALKNAEGPEAERSAIDKIVCSLVAIKSIT